MRILLAFAVVVGLYGQTAAQSSTVVFEWQYINVIEGYDHPSKMTFYIDGEYYGESSVTRNSEQNAFTLTADEGVHTFYSQNWANYEGEWEEVLVDNEYSMDANFTISLQLTPSTKRAVVILFDIESQKVVTVSIN